MQAYKEYYREYSITHPAYNVIRIAGKYIRDRASIHFSGKMLEIGCGAKKKGLLIGEFVEEHVGLDHEQSLHELSNINIYGTAYFLPIKDASYDCVLSTSVLEHLEEPSKALFESFRVLKPGGIGLFTMPLFWHLHEEPRDFFRYTKYGLHYLFDSSGFEILEILPLSGFWVTFGTELNYYMQRFRRGPLKFFVDGIVIMANIISPILDQGLLRDEKFCWQYLVLVRKPTDPC